MEIWEFSYFFQTLDLILDKVTALQVSPFPNLRFFIIGHILTLFSLPDRYIYIDLLYEKFCLEKELLLKLLSLY